ncbi:ribosome biogenesis GTPase [Candidatus Nanopelagicus limnes]|jgi:ribosome biogenesis GTPase / thiamine phosphate phosphatase|uniref:Ribosome biogenesis GTPase n=1 Tax=Candidatus Nanopelagicus limnae TaxID=1884634 RepID=A0A249JYY9_9ACTN|nr:ribosome small subunit-dependent GTPase A [Candidatus Nanopelagicus limnes]ASY09735.1 ribosome biogenesis GTPase [Candidatus Nanopelagicus limnes]
MVRSKSSWDEDDVRINKSRQFGASNKTRPRTKDRPDYSSAQTATIIEVDRGRVQCLIQAPAGKKIITAMKARELGKKSVVVGDLVSIVGDISGDEGSLARVVTVLPRKNSLTRSIEDHANDERVIVANIDQMAIVIAAANPEPKVGLVDRALVVAYDQGIKPIIIMTKKDLASGDDFLQIYKDLDIPVFKTEKSSDLSTLQNELAGKITVLLGHSGVGKSTLVNNLLASSVNKVTEFGIENGERVTGDVNEVTGRGRHTTSSAIALPLSSSFDGADFGWIIDTPGVRSFGIAHIQAARVISSFPEFSEAIANCQKNCTHNEPGCALNNWPTLTDQHLARLASLRRVLSIG